MLIKKRKPKKRKRKPIYVDIDEDYNNDENEYYQEIDGGLLFADDNPLIHSNKNNLDVLSSLPPREYTGTRRRNIKNTQHTNNRPQNRKLDDLEEDYDGDDNDDDDYSVVDQQTSTLDIPNHQLDRDGGVVSEIVGDDELHNVNGNDDYEDDSDEISVVHDSNQQDSDVSVLTKSVFDTRPRRRERPLYELPLSTTATPRYRRVYSRWSRWSKCSSKCTTRRFKKCRMKEICGNEVLRETAYCYVEGTFCQEWIKTQLPDANSYSASKLILF